MLYSLDTSAIVPPKRIVEFQRIHMAPAQAKSCPLLKPGPAPADSEPAPTTAAGLVTFFAPLAILLLGLGAIAVRRVPISWLGLALGALLAVQIVAALQV
jgi:hypothetical protein